VYGRVQTAVVDPDHAGDHRRDHLSDHAEPRVDRPIGVYFVIGVGLDNDLLFAHHHLAAARG